LKATPDMDRNCGSDCTWKRNPFITNKPFDWMWRGI